MCQILANQISTRLIIGPEILQREAILWNRKWMPARRMSFDIVVVTVLIVDTRRGKSFCLRLQRNRQPDLNGYVLKILKVR